MPTRVVLAIGAFALGVFCLWQAYQWSVPQPGHPLAVYFLTGFGNLLIFTTAYAFVNDHFLHRNYVQDIERSLRTIRLDESIARSGLKEVRNRFTDGEAFRAIQSASTVSMLIMRGGSFFRDYHESIKRCLADGLTLQIVLPNPNNTELMKLMAAKQSDAQSPEEAAAKIATVPNTWIIDKIHNTLPEEARSRIRVSLLDKYPLYSA